MSSFDVFTLPNPGTNGTGMRNGNPSAATALSLDGTRLTLPDGTIGVIEVFTLPVNYPPFGLASASATNPTNFPMQEETIGPYFMPGPQRVDASISMSQGSGDQFNLEMWNGRFHGPSAGNDNITLCPTANSQRLPQVDDCDDYRTRGWNTAGRGGKDFARIHNDLTFMTNSSPGGDAAPSSRSFEPPLTRSQLSGSNGCVGAMACQLHVQRLYQHRDRERQRQHVHILPPTPPTALLVPTVRGKAAAATTCRTRGTQHADADVRASTPPGTSTPVIRGHRRQRYYG
jgi:hypothetical protein